MKKIVLALLVVLLCLGSAYAQGVEESAVVKTNLLVSAAASLTDCMGELASLYMAQHPQVTIDCNFGSSGALQQQIEQGAPADIFFSAGVKQMKALQDKALMEDATVRNLLQNRVVLITPQSGVKLAAFEDLLKAEVTQIGVGEPKSVPVGQYTEEIFKNLGLTAQLAPKLIFAKDVREVLSWVETGNVQAGIVYETDAMISKTITICASAPEGSHKPVVYPVGVVKNTRHAVEAKALVDFLGTVEAAAIFARYGFTVLQ